MDDIVFTIEIHHGGHFLENPLRYIDGLVNHVDDCVPDLFSKLEVEDIVQRLGYNNLKMLWYRIPGLGLLNGLRVIGNDNDALDMTRYVKGHNQIEVYVEHIIDEVQVVSHLALPPPQMDEVHEVLIEEGNVDRGMGEDKVCYSCDTDDRDLDIDIPLTDDSDYDDILFDKYTEKEDLTDQENCGNNDLFDSDNEMEDQTNIDEVYVEGMRCDHESEELITGESESETKNEDNQSNDTLKISKFEVLKPVDRAENLRFTIGMLFSSLEELKTAITEYSVHGGYGIKFTKNED
ncbi:hypothetical protein Vadar_001004 [Vaccinium darrowii]|uniref:Uncharacterized protein n=1 Tax=Vaccinium darrowii TaxID=229202 RepID=A0ACB7XEZ2_9ERIC|nr:hypothetical protein Vadar_001004 [Vaccinium darrowii]